MSVHVDGQEVINAGALGFLGVLPSLRRIRDAVALKMGPSQSPSAPSPSPDRLRPREADDGPFELWRQDDNGNRVLIRRFDDRAAAEAEAARFEALGHRQTYWVEPRDPSRGEEA